MLKYDPISFLYHFENVKNILFKKDPEANVMISSNIRLYLESREDLPFNENIDINSTDIKHFYYHFELIKNTFPNGVKYSIRKYIERNMNENERRELEEIRKKRKRELIVKKNIKARNKALKELNDLIK